MAPPDWLHIARGDAPLIVSMPHTGTDLPREVAHRLVSPWLARKDCDWHVERLYDFAAGLGATTVRTTLSRTLIDVNRDPSGAALYPGRTTTGLCPLTTFDGEALYRPDMAPDDADIIARRAAYFDPYHAALAGEIERLRARHGAIVLYEAHSIRSIVPALFDGVLAHFNIGAFDGKSCAAELCEAVEHVCANTDFTRIVDGRFKGGYITRHYGQPRSGVHAIQMELAMRGYLREPDGALNETNWPPAYDEEFAQPMRAALADILSAAIAFARAS